VILLLCRQHHHSETNCMAHPIMRTVLLASVFVLFFSNSMAKDEPVQTLTVVPTVDLTRYAGTWYEIARLPNWFQKQCTGDVTATYTILEDGTIKVVNSCRKVSGRIEKAEGLAKQADKTGPIAKLKVRFAPKILSFLPFVWGDYWIIDLADDYSFAVVGDPDRKYLWVLSRTPVMDDSVLQGVLDHVKQKGYDLTGLIRTRQTEK
jgi:apolipoprotein D and lipocalin family protein